jgi:transposase
VDTHKDTHTAAVLDATGRLLGHRQFPTTPAGYALLLAWLRGHGELDKVGIEGTGVYGAGLALYLRVAVVELVESVNLKWPHPDGLIWPHRLA